MKSLVFCLFALALVSGVLSARLRRQAPPGVAGPPVAGPPGSDESGGPDSAESDDSAGPDSAESDDSAAPAESGIPEGVGPDMNGPPEGVPTVASKKEDLLNVVITKKLNELANDKALGLPLDVKKLQQVYKLCMVISIIGGEVNEPNQKALADLEA